MEKPLRSREVFQAIAFSTKINLQVALGMVLRDTNGILSSLEGESQESPIMERQLSRPAQLYSEFRESHQPEVTSFRFDWFGIVSR
jgi:hypothetical protein